MFFDVLACYHWLISTKHKVKLTLMGISFVLQMFGYKTTNRTNDNFDLMMVQPHGHALRSPSPHDTSSGNHECLLKILCQSTPDVLYKHTKKPITVNSKLAKVIQIHPLETRTFWEQFDGNILYSCSTSDATRSNVGVSYELWIFEPTWA